jgi:hypothetical protein
MAKSLLNTEYDWHIAKGGVTAQISETCSRYYRHTNMLLNDFLYLDPFLFQERSDSYAAESSRDL